MESRTETRNKIQTPTLVAVVVGLHVMAVGSVMFIQGCGTMRPPIQEAEPPAAIVMPPVEDARPVTPSVFQPPVAPSVTPPRVLDDPTPQVYTVQRGDVLSRIASRHGVSTAEIMDLNKISDPNKIVIGMKLLLPPHAKPVTQTPAASTAAPAAPVAPRAAPTASGKTYEVQAGDSISRIASRHGVSARDLQAVNNITDPNRIRVGQKLIIPGGASTPAPAAESATPRAAAPAAPVVAPSVAPQPAVPAPVLAPAPAQVPSVTGAFEYTVQAGDTLDVIARDFAVMKEDIIRLNQLNPDQALQGGQKLLIPPFAD